MEIPPKVADFRGVYPERLSDMIADKADLPQSEWRKQIDASIYELISDRAFVGMLGSSISRNEIDIGRAIALHGFQGVLQ